MTGSKLYLQTKVCQKIRGTKNVFTSHVLGSCWVVIIYTCINVGKLFPSRMYRYVEIFQQHFVVAKFQKVEKYALLSLATCVLQISTDEGLILANCECITISMLICLKSELRVKKGTFFIVLGENNE